MKRKYVSMFILLIILSSFLMGCQDKNTVVGEWQEIGNKEDMIFSEGDTVEFYEGGRLKWFDEKMYEYEILSDTELVIIVDTFDQREELFEYSFDGKNLILDEDIILKRVK